MNRLAFPALLCLFSAFAAADQAEWIEPPIADKALKLVEQATEIRHYCPLCDDKVYRPESVAFSEIAETETPGRVQILVNGMPIDLAYVYIEHEGKWSNLGKLAGAAVDSVPEVLPADLPAALPDFDRTKYTGTLEGGLHITMELSKFTADMSGTYYYSHVGQPLFLTGQCDPLGTFTLDENDADGKRTGTFSGKVLDNGARVEGSWLSGDGTKKLSFAARRIALHGDESGSAIAGSQSAETHLDYPVFLSAFGPAYAAVNEAVQAVLRPRFSEYAGQFVSTAAELGLDRATITGDGFGQSIHIGDSRILLANDQVVSLLFTVYLYQGGAHGMTMSLPLNLRISKAGDGYKAVPMTLASLLKPGAEAPAALSALLIEELKKQNASNVADGAIKAFKPEEMSAFTLSAKGATFYFDPYAVASYAEGGFRVFVPFAGNEAVFDPAVQKDLVPAPAAAPAPAAK